MRRSGTGLAVVLALAAGGLSISSSALAATPTTPDPAITNDPNASNGNIVFHDATGATITSGTNLQHVFDFAEATTNGRTGATKATAYFAFPDHTQSDSQNWNQQQITASTAFPNSSYPAPLGTSTHPVAKAGSSDANLKALLATTTLDTTAGYNGIVQVRLFDSGPGVPLQTAPFWATDIYFDAAAGTWQQVFPAPAATAPGAPTSVSATPGNASANVSWTAPSDGGSAITKYTITATPSSGSPVTKDVTGATSGVITGLTNGTQYAITVTATNSVGTGPASSPAVNVTPVAPATAPGAPTGVSGTAHDASADISWAAPASDGGSAITKYTVTAVPTSGTGTVTKDVTGATSTTLTGLTNGKTYNVTVTATNSVGTGPASSPAIQVSPTAAPTAPGAPTGVSATAGDATANVSWTAPASDGGSAITKYTVTAHPAAGSDVTKDVTGATSTQLTGLTNGTQYAITVTATNAIGTSPASSPAVNVTPKAPTAPGAPTGVSATAGDATANVSWTAPADNGGSAITKYTVTAHPSAGADVTKDVTGATSTQLTGLTNGTQYAITVTATNAIGTSPASSPAVNVTPKARTAPGAPTGVSATPADSAANVSWTAPADNGGAAITKYTVTATPAAGAPVTKDVTGATSTQVTGLTNGTQYAITVTATNSVGTSPASSPAVNVTPAVTAVTTGLSLSVSAPTVTAGDAFTVSGQLVGGTTAGKPINLQQTTPGSAPVTTVITTDDTGHFSVTVAAVYNASYKATFDGTDTQKPATSPVRAVSVRSRITVFHPTASNTRTTNRTITVTGRLYPALNGALVTLVLRGAHGNTQLAQAHVNSAGNFTLTRTVGKGTYLLQVGIGATPKNVPGASRLFRIYEV